MTGSRHILDSPINERQSVVSTWPPRVPTLLPAECLNPRLSRLRQQMRSHIRETLAKHCEGQLSQAEAEDFLFWLAGAFRQQYSWLERSGDA